MANKTADVLLRYTVDSASVQRVTSSNERVLAALNATKKQALSIEDAAERMNKTLAEAAREKAIESLVSEMSTAQKEGRALNEILKQTAERLVALGASDSEIRKVTRGLAEASEQAQEVSEGASGGGRRQVGRLGRFGREVRNLPAITLSGNLSTDAIGKILYAVDGGLTAIGATAGQVAGAAAIAAPALAVLAVGMHGFNKALDESKNRLAAVLSAQDTYYNALSTMTSQQAAEAAREASRRQATLAEQRAVTAAVLEGSFDQASSTFTDAGARFGTALGLLPVGQLQEQLTQLDAQIAQNDATVVMFTNGLRENAFAVNDEIAAQDARADALAEELRQLDALRASYDTTATRIQATIQGDRMTAAQREQTIQQNIREIQMRQQLIREGGLTEVQIVRLRGEMALLAQENITLSGITRSAADAAAELAAQEEKLANQRKQDADKQENLREQAQERLEAAQKRATEAAEKYLEAIEKTADARAKLASAERALFEFEQEAAEATRRIAADRRLREQEAEADKNEALLKQAEDYNKQRIAIERRYNATLANAIAARDALAAYLAKQTRAQEQQELEEQNSDRLREIDAAYQKQLKAAKDAADRQTAIEREKADRERAIRLQAVAQAQADLRNALTAEKALRDYYLMTQKAVQQAQNNALLAAQFTTGQQSVQMAQQFGYASGLAFAQNAQRGMLAATGTGGSVPTFPPLNAISSPTPIATSRTFNQSNVFNISGNDPNAIARAVDERLTVYTGASSPR